VSGVESLASGTENTLDSLPIWADGVGYLVEVALFCRQHRDKFDIPMLASEGKKRTLKKSPLVE
jgi:hypothetical protein